MTGDVRDMFVADRAALAPLAGVTDSVYRLICVEFGARPVMTEMVSADGWIRSRPGDKTARLLRFHEAERPIGFQLFGSDPAVMTAACDKAQDLEPDFIDVNAGCPVKKVIGRGAGSALMRTPDVLARILDGMVRVSRVPVTVKIRSGWDAGSVNAVEVARRCVGAGVAAVIVHPRTRSQGFAGKADWRVIAAVREAVNVPVIGSGDVWTSADALRMREETGAHAVMVGRAALGNPWIFREIAAAFAGKPVPDAPSVRERFAVALRHLELLADEVSERFAVLNMRKCFAWYAKGLPGASEFRQRVFRGETMAEVSAIVEEYVGETERRAARSTGEDEAGSAAAADEDNEKNILIAGKTHGITS